MSQAPALDVHFRVSFDQFELDISLQAGAEMVVIFGPSGAGKSLTLRTLAGLITPQAGYIRVAGQLWYDSRRGICLPPQVRRVGYVPQNYALFPHLSVAQNVAYGLHRLSREKAMARVKHILKVMRLEEQAACRPGELSGGQQQRVALARALVTEPQLLLMDEPLGALDAGLRERLRAELRAIQARFRIPTILITHDLAEAYSLAQQLVVISGGRIIQAGPRESLFRAPATPEVARVLGMSNILEARVLAHDEQGLWVDWAGHRLRLPVDKAGYGRPVAGQPIILGIRPEEVMFVRSDRPLRPGLDENIVEGQIVADDPQGFDHRLTVVVPSGSGEQSQILHVRLPHPVFLRLELAVGQQRRVALKPNTIHVFPLDRA